MPDESVILAAIAGVNESIGQLTAEVSGARGDLKDHVEKDDKRFRVLEGFDAEITGQRRVDQALANKVKEIETEKRVELERAEAKRAAELEKAEAKRENELAALRASRRAFTQALITALVSVIVAAVVTAVIAHMAWR